ncbi:MAG: hypothetical protein AAFN63_11405 [Pseudomonadota bacterium]
MKRSRIHVTDHAVLRYIERVMEIDVGAVRAAIAETVSFAEAHPHCTAVRSNGFRYVLVNNSLVTIRRVERSGNSRSRKTPKAHLS